MVPLRWYGFHEAGSAFHDRISSRLCLMLGIPKTTESLGRDGTLQVQRSSIEVHAPPWSFVATCHNFSMAVLVRWIANRVTGLWS